MTDANTIIERGRVGILVIGGGPAGLAAAVAAKRAGVDDVLIAERDRMLGGILNQCIHNGFGLHTFKEELTGPEYAARFISQAAELRIPYLLNTMVLSVDRDRNVTIMGREIGVRTITADAIVLAMGCRERSRGALSIPGYRPAGVYTAGTAQRLMNIEGFRIGKRVVILGSGDIGLIMARRMTLEGAKVLTVAELMPYSGGLKRNIVQCLNDYDIPLQLSHTVVDIRGKRRVEGVTIAEVDQARRPIPGTEVSYDCDTLLLSCGLLPENELTRMMKAGISPVTGGASVDDLLQTDIPGVFACGNVLHVHDLVDYVSEEATLAGENAAAYVSGSTGRSAADAIVEIGVDGGVRYTVPQRIDVGHMRDSVTVRFRVADVYRDRTIAVYRGEKCLSRRKTRVLAPGEMEQVKLKKEELAGLTADEGLRVVLED
ncbi:MAG: NAD(P)/FAD-dependent oxidoreductase [Lachnospiraceae bacterium]|nr:NAD(P)/FAD-dependent oxidoreductase [Lachnospiraceae bacterium]